MGLINEHDMTKKMIDTIRGGYKTLLNEQEDSSINLKAGDQVFDDELKKFSDTVDPRVEFTLFNIYPNDQNVIITGKLDIGIEFRMSKKDTDGLKIKTDNMDVNSDNTNILNKLNGYYQNWVRDWAEKLRTEYKPKVN